MTTVSVAFATASCLRNFHTFQQKLATWGGDKPGPTGFVPVVEPLVGGYIETFDEEPLPAAIADRDHRRLLDLVASLIFEPLQRTSWLTLSAPQRAAQSLGAVAERCGDIVHL
jgi:hypothetical protein